MDNTWVIDFHSHILPGIDDGSPDVETSLGMLRMAAQQGVEVQVLTPHYYAWKENIETFLIRRRESAERLLAAVTPGLPQLYIGAEVAFFPHMSRHDLSGLCIGGGNALLVEMPFETWDSSVMDEITTLSLDYGYLVILAHVERFLQYRHNPERLLELGKLDLRMQVNSEALLSFSERRRIKGIRKTGQLFLLGSDAHNLKNRKPNLEAGRRVALKCFGAETLREIDRMGADILCLR